MLLLVIILCFYYCFYHANYQRAWYIHGVGQARRGAAITLANAARLPNALKYAKAALRNYQSCPQGAEEDIKEMERLIENIELWIEK